MDIKEKLISAFSEVTSLGSAYSLADYDFYDTNKCFPSKGYEWISANRGLSKDELIPSAWPSQDIEDLNYQLKNSCILNKVYHWSQVTSKYLENHYFGLVHLEKESFLFYFPAWISLFAKDEISVKMSNLHFFKEMASLDFHDKNIFNWLNAGQKKFVVEFLSSVSGEWSADAELAHMMWESALQ